MNLVQIMFWVFHHNWIIFLLILIFTLKDLFSLVILFLFFFYIIFVLPDLLGHSDNYILANFLSTPSHIVPE